MKWLALIKKAPKFALVVGVIVGSTALFSLWWFKHSARKAAVEHPEIAAAAQEAVAAKTAEIEQHWNRMFLVGNDLYDAETDELIFKDWLKGTLPERLFYELETKKIIGLVTNGLVRFGLDGKFEGQLTQRYAVVLSRDFKRMIFTREKDIWTAEVDLKEFKLINERKATSIGLFDEQNFATNVFLESSGFLMMRNLNQTVRVNL